MPRDSASGGHDAIPVEVAALPVPETETKVVKVTALPVETETKVVKVTVLKHEDSEPSPSAP